jgi:hypothetical protein
MTTNDRFERSVATWFVADAAGHVPDHLAEVLAVSSSTRQRPAWSSLERWLPMDTTFRPRLLQAPRLSQVLVVAALIFALLAALVLYAGSRQSHLPAPFGPARNGTFIGSRDGDIYTIDAASSKSTLLIGGPQFDFAPGYSRDGTKLLFLRSATRPLSAPGAVASLQMIVGNADGSGLHPVTPPDETLDWFDWSPDGTEIAYVSHERLYVADAAGGTPRLLDGTGPAHNPAWLPPDGNEIVFRTLTTTPGIFAIAADGTGQRHTLSKHAPVNEYDFENPVISPDGRLIAFTQWGIDGLPSVHAIDIATGSEIAYPTAGTGTRGAVFSPDAKQITYARLNDDLSIQIVVAAADGSGNERGIGPAMAHTKDGAAAAAWTFAPDGKAVIARFGTDDAGTTYLIPLDGAASHVLDSGEFEFVDVQRLAP